MTSSVSVCDLNDFELSDSDSYGFFTEAEIKTPLRSTSPFGEVLQRRLSDAFSDERKCFKEADVNDVNICPGTTNDENLPPKDLSHVPQMWSIMMAPRGRDHCTGCNRRLVLTAKHSTPARVYFRNFIKHDVPAVVGTSSPDSGSTSIEPAPSPSLPANYSGIDFLKGGSCSDDVNPLPWPLDEPVVAAVGGFRVLSGWFGHQWVEFEVVVSSGARQQFVWRSLDDFARLVDTLGVRRKYRNMPYANLVWEMVQKKRRWWNATEPYYLVSQRASLDLFFEHLLYELDSPTQLFNFVDDATWHVGTSERNAAAPHGCNLSCP